MSKEILVFMDSGKINILLSLSWDEFEQVKKALAPLGLRFRSPSR